MVGTVSGLNVLGRRARGFASGKVPTRGCLRAVAAWKMNHVRRARWGTWRRVQLLRDAADDVERITAFALLLMLAARAVAVIHLPANPNAAACVSKLWFPFF